MLVAETTSSAQAVQRETRDIPIVMAPAGDPVGTGLVASLARRGGNVTGLSATAADVGGKLLQLVSELRPGITRVSIVAQANHAFGLKFVASLQPLERTADSRSLVAAAHRSVGQRNERMKGRVWQETASSH